MCYSAQVVQMVRKIHQSLGIRLDYAEAEMLFFRRLDDPTVNISRGFEANFDDPATEQGLRIKGAIDEHRSRTAVKLQKDLFSQKTRLVTAQRALQNKSTKKALEDVRIATSKIDNLSIKLSDLRRVDSRPADNRVFPMVYAGVIIKQDGENVLSPMRYACRPAGKPNFYDKKFPGLYNARRDNLERFWNEQYGRHHAVMIVESFYENVQLPDTDRNVVLQFTPSPPQTLFIACLWSHWTNPHEPDLRGYAAITDEPPPDVSAAGHDRCIINLRPENVEAWLTPAGRSRDDLNKILSDRAVLTYEHATLKAA